MYKVLIVVYFKRLFQHLFGQTRKS